MSGLRKAARWLVPAALALWLWTPLSAFVQRHREIINSAYADQGEALFHAVHRAPFDVSYHLPLAPLLEGLLLVHAGPAAGGACIVFLCLLGLGLLFAIGGLLGPIWCGWLFAWAGSPWAAAMPADSSYNTFLCTLFVLLAVCAMIYRARSPSLKADLILAGAIGSSLLVRSFLAFLPPLIVLYEWLFYHRSSWRRYWKSAAVLCLLPYLFTAPWAHMNWSVYHRVIPFEHDDGNGIVVTAAVGVVEGTEGDFYQLMDARPSPQDSVLPWAVKHVLLHPVRYARGFLGRILFVWKLFPFLLILAALSIWLHRDREEFRQLGLFCGYFILIHLFMSIDARYFLPLRPILAGIASTLLLFPFGLNASRKDSWSYRASKYLLAAGLVTAMALGAFAVRVVNLYAAAIARRPASSAAAIEEALARYPRDAWLLRQLGLFRLRQDDANGAAQALTQALAVAPGLPGAALELDLALAMQGNTAPLLSRADPVSAWPDPDDMVPPIYKAAVELRLGREMQARAELESALDLARRRWGLVRDAPSPGTKALEEKMRLQRCTRFVEHLDQLPLPDSDRLALAREVLRAHGAEEPNLSAAVAALAAQPSQSAKPDAERDRKYFYEDILQPFFVLDDDRPGFVRSQRPGASASSFAALKPAGTYRVFVIGGSIARLFMSGETDLSLADALGAAMPGKKIEVIDCGMPGYDSYREALIEREALDYSPDLLVLMTGHNESLGSPPAPGWVLWTQNLLHSWGLFSGTSSAAAAPKYAALERNLRAELRQAARRGAAVALVVPPLNYRDSPPDAQTQAGNAFTTGWLQYLSGDCRGALSSFAGDGGSLALYYAGICEERLGHAQKARASLLESVTADRDGRRCGPDCQATIRRVAAEEGAAAADVDAAFLREAAPDLPGLTQFSDGVHWRPQYNHLAVSAILDALKLGPAPVPAAPRPDPGSEALRTLRYALADIQGASAQRLSSYRLSHRALAGLDWVHARFPSWFADIPGLIRRAADNASPKGKAWGMAPLAPPEPAVFLHTGLMLLEHGGPASGGKLLDQAVKAAPKDPSAWLYAGIGSALAGRKKEAALRLSTALLHAADDRDRQDLSGQVRAAAGLFKLGAIADSGPDSDAESAVADARNFVRAGQLQAARACLVKAEKLEPTRQETWLNIALLWLDIKEYRHASEMIARLVQAHPKDPEFLMAAADAALRSGRREAGLKALNTARDLAPGDDQSRRIAFLYQQGQDYASALAVLSGLTRRRPSDAGLLKDRGICEFQLGMIAPAAQSLKDAIVLDPGLLDAYLSLGTLYSGQNQRDQARAIYDQALALPPRPEQAAVRALIAQSRAELTP